MIMYLFQLFPASAVHLIIEHSAYLISTRGPMGFWSQQSMEASHKSACYRDYYCCDCCDCCCFAVTKELYSRGTNHDGGRREKSSSALFQIIQKTARILVGQSRLQLLQRPAAGLDTTASSWLQTAAAVFQETPAEARVQRKAHRNAVKNGYTQLPKVLRSGSEAARRLTEVSESSESGSGSDCSSGEEGALPDESSDEEAEEANDHAYRDDSVGHYESMLLATYDNAEARERWFGENEDDETIFV